MLLIRHHYRSALLQIVQPSLKNKSWINSGNKENFRVLADSTIAGHSLGRDVGAAIRLFDNPNDKPELVALNVARSVTVQKSFSFDFHGSWWLWTEANTQDPSSEFQNKPLPGKTQTYLNAYKSLCER
jgi:hypothetical protein